MITYGRYGVKIGEVYFDEPIPPHPAVDILHCVQRPAALPGFRCTPFHTSVLDLGPSPDALLRNCKTQTRRIIRKGAAAGFFIARSPEVSGSLFTEIREVHRPFASSRQLADLDTRRISSLATAGRIALSLLRSPSGVPLAWHIWCSVAHRARLLVGGSRYDTPLPEEERKPARLANTYLCWQNILYFRDHGIKLVDFGGWYVGSDEKMLNINRFKAGFGGRIVEEFHCTRALTAKGRIAEQLKSVRRNTLDWLGNAGLQPESGLAIPTVKLGDATLAATGRFE
jgi:hypothetical protein